MHLGHSSLVLVATWLLDECFQNLKEVDGNQPDADILSTCLLIIPDLLCFLIVIAFLLPRLEIFRPMPSVMPA